MEGPLRFSSAVVNDRSRGDKDPSAAEEDGAGRGLPCGGFYDDSEAKLANRYEDRRLAMAIQGISLEKCRTVSEIDYDKKAVEKGFQKILSQQQLLDRARADNVIGPRHLSPANTPSTGRHLSPRRPQSSKNTQHSPSPQRRHLHLSPSSPNFSPQLSKSSKTGKPRNGREDKAHHSQDSSSRSFEGFRASRPLTSGGQRIASGNHREPGEWNTMVAEQIGPGPTSRLYKQSNNKIRARTPTGALPRGPNQLKPAPTGQNPNHDKPIHGNHNQRRPNQSGFTQHSADAFDTDTDEDTAVKSRAPRQRSKSAFDINQILSSSDDDDTDAVDSVSDPMSTPRQRSNSIHKRPHTAVATASSKGRSRRELKGLTHIDAITAAEMSLRRKMWLAQKEAANHVGDTALQQKVQEFITKLDADKKKESQKPMMFDGSKGKAMSEQLVLPAVL